MYKFFIRPVFFLFDAESIHNFVLFLISKFNFLLPIFSAIYNPKINNNIFITGINFKHKLGLAAGFDKNGVAIRFWDAIGFSHIEVGTVTPLPQPGNPKPRIFRLPNDSALINRLGFNNKGAIEVKSNILKAKPLLKNGLIIGVNIGKNKDTPIDKASDDYVKCFSILNDVADYFTVNISSPNTKSLRDLQNKSYLSQLLSEIQNKNRELNKNLKPVFLKIAPDLEPEELSAIYEIVNLYKLSGVIATNTTVSRENLKIDPLQEGGLSGKPLKQQSDKILNELNDLNLKYQNKELNLIGVGGVFSKNDFNDKCKLGAGLVQIYTGFIYEGPSVIKKILTK